MRSNEGNEAMCWVNTDLIVLVPCHLQQAEGCCQLWIL